MNDAPPRPPAYCVPLAAHGMRLPASIGGATVASAASTRAPRTDPCLALLTGLVLRESLVALAGAPSRIVDIEACAAAGFGTVAARGAAAAADAADEKNDARAAARSHAAHASCALLALAALEAGDGPGAAPIEASLLTALSLARVMLERGGRSAAGGGGVVKSLAVALGVTTPHHHYPSRLRWMHSCLARTRPLPNSRALLRALMPRLV